MRKAETLALGERGRESLNRAAAEKLARWSDRLSPRPEAEDPQYLVAQAVSVAAVSEDPTRAVLEHLRGLDTRTAVLMLVLLVAEIAHPPDLERREGELRELADSLHRRYLQVGGAAAVAAVQVASSHSLGYSRESSKAWAEGRLEGLMRMRLDDEFGT